MCVENKTGLMPTPKGLTICHLTQRDGELAKVQGGKDAVIPYRSINHIRTEDLHHHSRTRRVRFHLNWG